MKKTILTTAIILSTIFSVFSQIDYHSSYSFGNTLSDAGSHLSIDNNGDIICIANFSDTVDVDHTGTVNNIMSKGGTDIALIKYDIGGNLIWAKSMGSLSADVSYDATIDQNNDIIITGRFNDSIVFDTQTLYATGSDLDFFVAKYNQSGTFQWAFNIDGSLNTYARGVCVDVYNNIYITGNYKGTIDFDPSGNTFALNSFNVSNDIFVAKYNTSGSFLWAFSMGNIDTEWGADIISTQDTNIVVVGYYKNTINFDPVGTYNLTSGVTSSAFIAKYDTSGNFIWANSLGVGISSAHATDIYEDKLGNLLLSGSIDNTVDFDFSGATNQLNSVNGEVYLAKYDSDCNYLWANNYNISGSDHNQITVSNSKVYLTGRFSGTKDIDPSANTHYVISNGNDDICIIEHDANGAFINGVGIGSSDYDFNNSVTSNDSLIIITGRYRNTMDFDPSPNTHSHSSNGDSDWYIAAYISDYCASPQITTISQNICLGDSLFVQNAYQTTAGTYYDTLASIYLCDSIIITNLTVTTVDTSVSINVNTINANAPGLLYQWINCDSLFAPILGETNQYFTASTSGNYAVIITQNGCIDTSACYSILITDINETPSDIKNVVFPNPTKGKITVECEGMEKVEVLDVAGKVVYEIAVLGDVLEIDLSVYSKGVYFVRVMTQNGVGVERIVLE
jgi:Secretion system C-terminal sorting domain